MVLMAERFPGIRLKRVRRSFDASSGKRELPLESLPMLVRFRDLNDPMTVESVSPLNIGERFGGEPN